MDAATAPSWFSPSWVISLLLAGTCCMAAGPSLAERLGYKATDRLLIVNGDDLGMCQAANAATFECLERGLMRSASVMVPCPWFPDVVARARNRPGVDLGVHLTHTSEWSVYRWGPVLPREQVPGLVDPAGYFWRSVPEVYAHATPEQALREARAQIRRALEAGLDVTHLDSHMGTLQLNPAYMEVYLALAVEFDLPVRMASAETLAKFGQAHWRQRFAERGILFPDDFVYEGLPQQPEQAKRFWMERLRRLSPGVTEFYIHAAHPTQELKAITASWAMRAAEYELFTNDPELRALVQQEGIVLIGYRPLRDLQRKLRAEAAGNPCPAR
jgi:predicted glycoside hydrolase/deacetylase ChbG (UPF0249 family)